MTHLTPLLLSKYKISPSHINKICWVDKSVMGQVRIFTSNLGFFMIQGERL